MLKSGNQLEKKLRIGPYALFLMLTVVKVLENYNILAISSQPLLE